MQENKANPSEIQARASNPRSSVWVAASAGTGKTKVLTDRILRLLLDGAELSKILCLTFTKNAAAEMVARLLKTTRSWVSMDDETLRKKLIDLFQSNDGIDQHLAKSRTLFATILEDVQTLKVKTIHAFCQQILKKFAIEANLNPAFVLMDDFQQKEMLNQSYTRILSRAEKQQTPSDLELYQAFDVITQYMDENTFAELQGKLIGQASKFHHLFAGRKFDVIWADQLKAIGIDDTLTKEAVLSEFWDGLNRQTLEAIASDFLSDPSKKKASEAGSAIMTFLRSPEDNFDFLSSIFLKKTDGQVKSQGLNKKELYDHFVAIGEAIIATTDRLKTLIVCAQTKAVLRIAYSLLTDYQNSKTHAGLMDFDDLILHTQRLFEKPDIAPWILYKLDGGIDHILVDEAQDTSPVQWKIIDALCSEFFSDGATEKDAKTLFVVGDQKQSIYSFQGADVRSFIDSHHSFEKQITESGHPFEDVPLATSFRTVSPILKFVDTLFAHDPHSKGVIEKDDPTVHNPWRTQDAGIVEFWPLPKVEEKDQDDSHFKPSADIVEISNPVKRMAGLIAERIHTMIMNKEILPSENRPVEEKDFLILTRSRGTLAHYLSTALKNHGLKFEGIDRFKLLDHIAAQDLIAAAQFVLYPHDDLNLAGFLKSPIVGATEDDLFKVAHDRGDLSIWDRMQQHPDLLPDAYAVLSTLYSNRHLSVYAFYTFVVEQMGGREKILYRLGLNALDPLEEFISLTSDYEQSHIGDLQHFVQFIQEANPDIKREQEQEKKDGIRLMTVHGSKGLEAPIVFLVDTCSVPRQRDTFFWDHTGHFFMATHKEYRNAAIDALVEEDKAKTLDEYRRLLYVAMTRARDQLYITGESKPSEGSWYDMIRHTFQTWDQAEVNLRPAVDLSHNLFDEDAVIMRIETPQIADVCTVSSSKKTAYDIHQGFYPTQPMPTAPHVTENILEPVSIFDTPDIPRVLGTRIHQILEYFPHLSIDERATMIEKSMQSIDIPEDKKEHYIQSLKTISSDPKFDFLFSNQLSEASFIEHRDNERHLLLRPDKIVFNNDEIWVIDYKTDFNPPSNVPGPYLKQLTEYKNKLTLVYNNNKIRLFILWISNTELKEIV